MNNSGLYPTIWKGRIETYKQFAKESKRELNFWEEAKLNADKFTDKDYIQEKYAKAKYEYETNVKYIEFCKKQAKRK